MEPTSSVFNQSIRSGTKPCCQIHSLILLIRYQYFIFESEIWTATPFFAPPHCNSRALSQIISFFPQSATLYSSRSTHISSNQSSISGFPPIIAHHCFFCLVLFSSSHGLERPPPGHRQHRLIICLSRPYYWSSSMLKQLLLLIVNLNKTPPLM